MAKDLYHLSSYQFDFDESLIALYPATPRDTSRLMVVDRETGNITEMIFHGIYDILEDGDSIIFNNTKVIPARLKGKRACGGSAEILLHKPFPDGTWEVIVKPGRKLGEGARVSFGENFSCEVISVLPNGARHARFHHSATFEDTLDMYGEIPLPHYIKRSVDKEFDSVRYQTVYAQHPGSVAAPTAGLHFTHPLLARLDSKGVQRLEATLHVGLGTFKPLKCDDIRDHFMHSERCFLSPEAAAQLNRRDPKKKQICVGTTCCRLLEAAASDKGRISSGEFETALFIYPGYRFKYVRALLTNFHLPGSTLLTLVSAFAGYELIMEAYKRAVKEKYRFFSYGDAMLIL